MKNPPKRIYRGLAPADLRYVCPDREFPWPDTSRAPALLSARAPVGPAGQERALAAIDFGLAMPGKGFNLFLIGEPGCGKTTAALALMGARALREPVPRDWCYVHNFADPRRPLALSFPPGGGREFARRMKEFAAALAPGGRRENPRALLAAVAAAHPGERKLAHWLAMVERDLAAYSGPGAGPADDSAGLPGFSRYLVNLFVDNGPRAGAPGASPGGAPVVTERTPSFANLIGRVEHGVRQGMAVTDHLHLRAGALHRANGGYLLLNALELVRSPFAWEALRTALKAGSVKIEEPGEQARAVSPATLVPEAIPLAVKVALAGPPDVYYMLFDYDDDMPSLFKVKADFGVSMKRDRAAIRAYARLVAEHCGREGLLPFAPSALAAVVEFGCRDAEDKGRLSTRVAAVADLARESSYWAAREKAKKVTRAHVTRAQAKKEHRHNRVEERVGDLIDEGTLIVETAGAVTGQVNGLSVFDLGDHAFAKPTRITAKVTPGKSGIVQIDREVKLSGVIHSKGVMIVSSCLAERYAYDYPLSLSASLTFEQAYEEVEGDSASAAEFLALVSAIARIPLNQGIAVTGSIDQHGRVQPVGGVNEKVEGFFATCKRRRLTGRQAVIVPRANVRNLMLSWEVVQACAAGRFGVFAAGDLDEVIEIATGIEAGKRGKKGAYPEHSFNRRVDDALHDMAELVRAFDEPEPPHESGGGLAEDGKEGEGKPGKKRKAK